MSEPGFQAASLWLTRPSDIHAHLRCAASEHRPVELSGGGLVAQGVFEFGTAGTCFVPDPLLPIPLPRLGSTVRAEYYARTDTFSFFSRLVGVDASGRWVLQPPLAVERTDRRAAHRQIVAGASGFCFRLLAVSGQPLLGLYNVSEQGIAIVADPRRHNFGIQDQLEGQLHLPNEAPITMLTEVRHSREFPRQANLRIYGTRFLQIEPDCEARLRHFLLHWKGTNIA